MTPSAPAKSSTRADILDAITYLNERNPTAAAHVDADITGCIEHLAFRIYYQRHSDELLIVRVYHQRRRPIAR